MEVLRPSPAKLQDSVNYKLAEAGLVYSDVLHGSLSDLRDCTLLQPLRLHEPQVKACGLRT